MGYSLSIILLTKVVCKDSSKKGIMNAVVSLGTALGASLYNLIGELSSLIRVAKRLHSTVNFMNLKSPIILKNILF